MATIDVTTSNSNLTINGGSSNSSGGLTKIGLGTLTLNGSNAHTGDTKVNAGTLNVTGSLTSTETQSQVTVGGSGSSGTPTLAGYGFISGATTIAAAGDGVVGIHSPGDRTTNGTASLVGLQTFDSTLAYGAHSIFEWDLTSNTDDIVERGVAFDGVDIAFSQKDGEATGTNANLTIGSDAIFRLVLGGTVSFGTGGTADGKDLFWNVGHSWQVFDDTLALGANSFYATSNFTVDASAADYAPYYPSGSFSFNNTNGTLNWTAVPEPSSALAGMLLGAGLLRRRRK